MIADNYEYTETHTTEAEEAAFGKASAIVPDGIGWELDSEKKFGTMIVYVWRRPIQQKSDTRRVSIK